jgi:hypothetical protein
MSIQPVLHSVMTEAQYDAERAKIAPDKATAGVWWEQDLAQLFARSGWTQEKLAKKEGKSRQWVAFRLTYGRFLMFATNVANAEKLPNNLTEGRFRDLWFKTDQNEGNERIRFQQVLKFIKDNTRVHEGTAPKGHAKAVREQFADGKWHSLAEIAEALETDGKSAEAALRNMRKLGSVDLEHRLKGRDQHNEYRLFAKEKTVSATELAEKLGPIIKDLKIEGKKNMATMVPAVVAMLAERLQRLLDEWTA